jgi:protein-S-isoprenylcysteine O-methyltransferase Ste14
MFPLLVVMYVHLAHAEEAEARLAFGTAYDHYADRVPGWFPNLRQPGIERGLT